MSASFDPISAGFSLAETVIKRIWQDPDKQAEALHEMAKLQQAGDFKFLDAEVQLLMGQLEINKIEAAHGGLMKGGWRPFIGWVCGVAMAVKFVLVPVAITSIVMIGWIVDCFQVGGYVPFPYADIPEIEWTELWVPLGALLGIGGLRTYEKTRTEQAIRN
jgi:hypothetical protein